MHTPDNALKAMVEPAPLTLGQVALLDLYKLPILEGTIDDVNATAFALWLLDMPLEQAVAEAHFPEKAIVWAAEVGVDGYNERLVKALDGIRRFYGMLPKAETGDDGGQEDLKKKCGEQETATSPRSPSSSAARTGGRFATFFRRFLPSRRRSSTAAGGRGLEG